ncbi:Stp1/IreP family PP2C-type Ser/Thr phosphatase [Clostridium sp. MD294]|uniref:Stp1/IreP family PP2C-type Ser/Thr phosphatase n=1 Tax=Clostridium sp. MD294 TaxID=97138 RepID=UPI0002C8E348|nr:Stp1/IreP family PP2C-type Ser/Thr phosphatase [Clostridium sp. MD294]NDO46816.1 Stp1/IreP family PP2C-type Ser/Thr phosphatase [Clostridium sp. MD294]USF28742.1 Protein phosphatase PrpC [Clostridium sp. MD294]
MKAVGNSVIGMRRTNNEDAIYINEQKNLYLVADGMGGCNAGEVASSTAITAFVEAMENAVNGETLDKMINAVAQCNKKVYKKSKENIEFLDMGTTLVAVTIENEKMFVVHVGDSRVYLFRENNLQQITTDHSYVMELVKIGSITREEAEVHPKRNIITRAIGIREEVEADTIIEEIKQGNKILLCTDGLSNMVSKKEITKILIEQCSTEEKVKKLVALANEKGGLDNISLILIEI